MTSVNRIIAFSIIAALLFLSVCEYRYKHAESSDVTLKDKLIVIDPGHGGIDGGASLGEHFNEKDINLDISLKLRELLTNAGVKVILTRDSDISLENKSDLQSSRHRRDLDARRDIVDNSDANVFISVHSNCFRSNPDIKGAILFYYYASEEGKSLAQWVSRSIDEIVYRNFLKNYTLESKILPESLFLLRSTKVPGILVETGYMTNQEEGRLLRQDDFQTVMAEAIFDGLQKYYKKGIIEVF
ncbi:MAG: N-acetylmuramoyl-L-alanine amidase family protein [Clostridia bacterium]